MSGAKRKGRWRAAPRITAFAMWGGVSIDLREAVLEGPTVDITAWAVMGNVVVTVPDGVLVELGGSVFMGSAANRTKPAADDDFGAPLVRVRARGLWGGVAVRSASRTRSARKAISKAGTVSIQAPPPAPRSARHWCS